MTDYPTPRPVSSDPTAEPTPTVPPARPEPQATDVGAARRPAVDQAGPAPAPAAGLPPTVTEAEADEAPAPLGPGAGGIIAIAQHTPPGEVQQYRYGIVLGRRKPNDDAPEGNYVLLLPEGAATTVVFDDAEGVVTP